MEGRQLNDEDGNQELFEVFFDRFEDEAYRLAVLVLQDDDLAEDVVLSAFAEVHGAISDPVNPLVDEQAMRVFLCQKVFAHAEKYVPHKGSASAVQTEFSFVSLLGRAQRVMESSDLSATISFALRDLDSESRAAFLLHDVLQFSREAAEAVLHVQGVEFKSALSCARTSVREFLKESGGTSCKGKQTDTQQAVC